MGILLAPALAGMMLITSPQAADADDVDVSGAEMLSAAAGSILGAATMCHDIDHGRLSALTGKVAVLVSGTVGDESELATVQQTFAENAQAGKQAVASGAADCRSVERSVTQLEQIAEAPAEEGEWQ